MPRRAKKKTARLPPLLEEMETEPVWHAWLLLTPAERLARAWRHRRSIRDPEAIHDAKTLPSV